LQAVLRDIVGRILDQKRFRAFHNRVDEREVPDYAALIAEPVWVKLIHDRVGKMQYLRYVFFFLNFLNFSEFS
jgi:hypothetical protein